MRVGMATLADLLVAYLLAVEGRKQWFYRRLMTPSLNWKA